MTIEEFYSNLYTTPNNWDTAKLVVFDNEESLDMWASAMLGDTRNHGGEIFCTLYSNILTECYLKESICNSEILKILAVGRDCIGVWADIKY